MRPRRHISIAVVVTAALGLALLAPALGTPAGRGPDHIRPAVAAASSPARPPRASGPAAFLPATRPELLPDRGERVARPAAPAWRRPAVAAAPTRARAPPRG